MYGLVNDVTAYPRRFAWCEAAQVLEASDTHMLARLELRVAGMPVAFTTRNTLEAPTRIGLHLVDGPFSALEGQWRFHRGIESSAGAGASIEIDAETQERLKALGYVGD